MLFDVFAFRGVFFDPDSIGGSTDLARRSETLELIPKFRESSAHPTVMAFWTF